ncbi:MAG: hypothetical protein AAF600_13115 [Bacteroidota bacterium]
MKVTTIDMSKLKDKSKPFSTAIWEKATPEQENKFMGIFAAFDTRKPAS